MTGTTTTRTETDWSAFAGYAGPAWHVWVFLAVSGVLLAVLGRWVGLRTPGAWMPVWVILAALGRANMEQHGALSGWLFLAGTAGTVVCAALAVRQSLPKA